MRAVLASLALAAPLAAQCTTSKLVEPNGIDFDGLGYRVEIEGERLLAVANGDDTKGSGAGAVHVYDRVAGLWTHAQKLVASDGAAIDTFGISTALEGDRIVVGASGHDVPVRDAGAVYVFDRVSGVWSETAKLTRSSASQFDALGFAVALSGTTLVAGAPMTDLAGSNSGCAYVYDFDGTNWSASATLQASDARADEWFGYTAALDGDTLVLTALAPAAIGSAYVFERSGGLWSELAKLQPAEVANGDAFGFPMDLDGDTFAVSARFRSDQGANSGAVYVFEEQAGAWVWTTKLLPSDGVAQAIFGGGIGVAGERIVVGAFQHPSVGVTGGAIYLYEQVAGAWIEREKHVPTGLGDFDGYGVSVDASANDFVGGAFGGDEVAVDAGAVYTRAYAPGTCTLAADTRSLSLSAGGQQTLTLTPGVAFAGAFYWVAGSASGTAPGFAYGATTLPLNADPWFLASVVAPNFGPFVTTAGFLDALGAGTAAIVAPPASPPALAGLTLSHAFVVFDATSGTIPHLSNAEALRLDP